MRIRMLFACVAGFAVGGCVPPEPLSVMPSALPNGAVGSTYYQELTTDSPDGAIWSVVGGELPPGLSLGQRSGAVEGIPEQAGTFTFTVRAADAGSLLRQGEAGYTVVILEQLRLGAVLAAGRVQEPYSQALSASGGVPPYTFNVIGLPAGIGLDPATGVISGTPIYPVDGELLQVAVSDSGTPRQLTTASVPLVIKNLPVRIATETLPDVVAGSTSYSQKLQAAEGVPPYSWAVVGGDLKPLGLELVLSTGEIRNRRDAFGQPVPIPAGAAASTFTVRVTDSDSPPSTATKQFTVGVAGSVQ